MKTRANRVLRWGIFSCCVVDPPGAFLLDGNIQQYKSTAGQFLEQKQHYVEHVPFFTCIAYPSGALFSK